jgi:hypothetical protein
VRSKASGSNLHLWTGLELSRQRRRRWRTDRARPRRHEWSEAE